MGMSRAALGRLPLYLDYLHNLADASPYISAARIAQSLNLGEVQVRKDLSSISGKGRPKLGYLKAELTRDLTLALRGDAVSYAVIAGAGSLGRALLDYEGFSVFGLEIAAAFDSDPQRLGTSARGKPILPWTELSDYCRSKDVRIGIIAVPASAAQTVCEAMLANGIAAIWNFAPCTLDIPDGVAVKYENLALSLAHLKTLLRTTD
ncbi:MAG: redox-sensing transcriptional repressor Rex [bacterium]|nr:redox-sensing transcriptional repressor Rex [bacterium]